MADASVWVSRYVRADAHHAASYSWLLEYLASGCRVVAPTLLLIEVGSAVARRTSNPGHARRIVAELRRLPGVRWVGLTDEVRDRAAELAIDLRLRSADAVYVALADRLGVALFTWDAEQLARATAAIAVHTP